MNLIHRISDKKEKQFAILVDPEQCNHMLLKKLVFLANASAVDHIFVGGSLLVNDNLDKCIRLIKEETNLPVIIFPGPKNGFGLPMKCKALGRFPSACHRARPMTGDEISSRLATSCPQEKSSLYR